MTNGRRLLFSVIVPLGTIVLMLLAAELVLRILPAATGLRAIPVDAAHPVFHFLPDRAFVSSRGWDMHGVIRGRVNNAGFVNDQDYQRDGPRPLLAIVGDSYIEAAMVPYAETVQGRLAAQYAGKLRVYSFGASGAPLSQYLIWARHAVREYGARAVVINVVGNDFDESLQSYGAKPGFWQYAPDSQGVLHLRLTDYRPGWAVAIARHSALLRYLTINLHANSVIFSWRPLAQWLFGMRTAGTQAFKGNTSSATDPDRVRQSLEAIDAFFRDLPEQIGLSPSAILFTLDGFRYEQAAASGRGSYFDLMRKVFMQKATALGYETVDLDTRFLPFNQRTGEAFDFPDDGHWNSNGHAVAAEAVAASKLLQQLVH